MTHPIHRSLGLALMSALLTTGAAQAAVCTAPDNGGGTVDLPAPGASCGFETRNGPLQITPLILPAGTTIDIEIVALSLTCAGPVTCSGTVSPPSSCETTGGPEPSASTRARRPPRTSRVSRRPAPRCSPA